MSQTNKVLITKIIQKSRARVTRPASFYVIGLWSWPRNQFLLSTLRSGHGHGAVWTDESDCGGDNRHQKEESGVYRKSLRTDSKKIQRT